MALIDTVLEQVARQIGRYFAESGIRIDPVVTCKQVTFAPYTIKVDILEPELEKKNCAWKIADNLIHHIKKHQNEPDRVFIYKFEDSVNVDGIEMRAVSKYFRPTECMVCRFSIVYC